jgi:ribosomal protein L31
MKKDIHPKYYVDVAVECICGNKFTVNATVAGPIKVEQCQACHPLYNAWKIITKVSRGRLEEFKERQKRMDEAMKKAGK